MSDESGIRVLAGRYRLITRLGHRMMRGWDTHLRQVVAVRLFPPPDDSDQVVARASELLDLAHPGLVRVLDAGNADGEPFLVMEFIAGTTLKARLAEGPLPAEVVGPMGAQLAKVLAYAHSRDVTHRDIRPGNVLLGPGDEPYLTDIALAETPTPAYVAPEQIEGRPPSPAADIYALGLVLVESLKGQVEYRGDDIATMRARLTHPPRIPQDLPLTKALEAMTAADPDDRPNATECVDLLQGYSQKARVQTRTVLIAAVSAAVVATGVAFFVNQSNHTPPPRQASVEEPLRQAPPPRRAPTTGTAPAGPTVSDASTPVVQERPMVTTTSSEPPPPPSQQQLKPPPERTTITLTDSNNDVYVNDQGEDDDDEYEAVLPQVKNPPVWYKALQHYWKVKKAKKNKETTAPPPPS